MDGTALIIAALGVPLATLPAIIWAVRCPRDSPNYKRPTIHLSWWRKGE